MNQDVTKVSNLSFGQRAFTKIPFNNLRFVIPPFVRSSKCLDKWQSASWPGDVCSFIKHWISIWQLFGDQHMTSRISVQMRPPAPQKNDQIAKNNLVHSDHCECLQHKKSLKPTKDTWRQWWQNLHFTASQQKGQNLQARDKSQYRGFNTRCKSLVTFKNRRKRSLRQEKPREAGSSWRSDKTSPVWPRPRASDCRPWLLFVWVHLTRVTLMLGIQF